MPLWSRLRVPGADWKRNSTRPCERSAVTSHTPWRNGAGHATPRSFAAPAECRSWCAKVVTLALT